MTVESAAPMVTLPLRRFGSRIVHAARVPVTSCFGASWAGSTFTAVEAPAVADCGAVLWAPYLVVMTDPATPTCRACLALRAEPRR